jgi:tripartite-type tricarboxylate transporter receptor subunit TctC
MKILARVTDGLLFCAAIAVPMAAWAQPYPSKVIRVINPASPGGNSDIIFRLLAGKMGEILGQQLVVDYRPGAGGRIGSELTARSAPDGYTTALVGAFFVTNPSLIKSLPFDTVRDFTPMGLVVDIPASVTLHPSLPVKHVKELIALAKNRPGQIFFSSSGAGAIGHLAGELLNSRAGIKLVHVPYKGISPAVIDLLAGQVQLSFPSIPVVIQHVRGGKLRMIAVCGNTRSPSVPDVPTMQEAGLADFVVSSGFMFVGPANIPPPVVEKFNQAMAGALQDPAIRRELIDSGAVPVGNSPEQHAAYIKSEIEKWNEVVRAAGIPRE